MRARPPALPSLAAAAALAALLATALPAAPASAATECGTGLTYVWDGASDGDGDGVSWDDGHNWDIDCTPGLAKLPGGAPKPDDDVVTVPAGNRVVLRGGEQASLARLTNGGTLVVSGGAALSVRQASTSARTVLRGLLFGAGTFTVTGRMDWVATAGGSSTMSTRRCAVVDCSSAPATPGRTVVAKGAVLRVPDRGVNLSDDRVLDNRGTVSLSGRGYVAADYGTAYRAVRAAGAPAPRFVIANDGGWYQGFAVSGRPLGVFTNTGLLLKSGGDGRSVVDADYRATDPGTTATGRVEVRTGTLEITTAPEAASTATVQQGAAFGNTGRRGPTSGDPQSLSVALTQPGTTRSPVTVQELPGEAVPGGLGVPVRIETPGATASATAPLQFRLLYDRTALGGASAGSLVGTAPVWRRPDGATSYAALPDCADQDLTVVTACVDRALSASETAARSTGDLVLVVDSLANSRYRVG